MRVGTRLVGLMVAGTLTASALQAQTCLGFSSFESARMNVSVIGAFKANPLGTDGTSIGGQLNAGSGRHFFGVGLSSNNYDDPISESSITIGGIVGIENRGATVEWCPSAGIAYEMGPFDEQTTLGFSAGVGLGKVMGSTGSFMLVPFGGAHWTYYKTSFDECPPSFDCDDSENGVMFTGGAGFRFNNGMQITPAISFSTIDDSDPVFRIGVSFPLGRR